MTTLASGEGLNCTTAGKLSPSGRGASERSTSPDLVKVSLVGLARSPAMTLTVWSVTGMILSLSSTKVIWTFRSFVTRNSAWGSKEKKSFPPLGPFLAGE